MPQISIITPVWNGMPFLQECIDSVIRQDFQDWEMLISDDGSDDGSKDYLDLITDKRIKVFKQKENQGIFGNLNFLFDLAQAPICQILCQDDHFMNARALGRIVHYWRLADPAIGFVRFNHNETANGETMAYEKKLLPSILPAGKAAIWFYIFGNIPGNLSNMSLRTKIVLDSGGFDAAISYAGDFEFWVRAAKKVSIGVQKEMLVRVRRHDGVASSFLNLKGELYPQHMLVYENLINQLVHAFDKRELIRYFNLGVCSFHYRLAIKLLLQGEFAYLRSFLTTESSMLWPKWRQLIACLPFALSEKKRTKLTVELAKKLLT